MIFLFSKKSLTMPKKSERAPFSRSWYCMLRGKTLKKLFWFSSLSQMFQFGTMKFRRTFKNYFGQFVWVDKKSHYNSRVSLHEAPIKKWDHASYFPASGHRGKIRQKVQIPLCRHRLRWNFGHIK